MMYETMKLLRMATIFKTNLSRWPKNVGELLGFVEQRGWTVDVSSYYTLAFKPMSPTQLAVEMAWPAPANGLSRARVEVEEVPSSVEDQLFFTIKKTKLPDEKREAEVSRFAQKPLVAHKKSA